MATRCPNTFLRRRSGFTLLEALIALVMFTIITFALSLALSTAVRSHDAAQKREHDASTVRSVFSIISRDIQGAFISKRNPASVFIANNGGSGSSSSAATTGSLLTITTLSYRVQPGDFADPLLSPDGNTQSVDPAGVTPQADFALVRYDLDTTSGTLTRSVVPVPNLDLNKEPSGTPDSILSDRVTSLTLRFYDPAQKTWRNDWDYQQTNQGTSTEAAGTDPAMSDNPADPLSGLGGGTDTSADSSTQSQATGDNSFPSAVEMTIMIMRSDNTSVTYKTMIPIITPYLPQDPTTTTGAAGTGGGNTGGANSNGTQPRN